MEIMIPEARLSFDVLGAPEGYQGKPPLRWGAVFLIPKGSETDKAVRAALQQLVKDTWPKSSTQRLDPTVIYDEIMGDKKASCYLDGDKKAYDGYEGMMALSAYRYEDKGRPVVLDNDASPIYNQSSGEIYPGKAGRLFAGCYVRGKVELWPQNNTHGKGLRATLMVVQRLRTGDAFGGGKPATAEGFDAVEEGADADDLA